ncbi:MAG: hypothetical protein OCU24_03295 [Candidatus Methanospirare jalkutatii]|nr:hypothetical protein [Candidatus Methanospirare jalkutatii]
MMMRRREKSGGSVVSGNSGRVKALSFASAFLLTVLALQVVQAATVNVERVVPASVAPSSEFEVLLRIEGEPPLVVGIVEKIPEGFSFVSTNCKHFNISGQKVAFAAINATEIRYKVKAPSSGEGTFSGSWIDFLSEKEENMANTTVIIKGTTPTIASPSPLPTASPTPTPTSTPTPTPQGFEALFAIASVLLLSLFSLGRGEKGRRRGGGRSRREEGGKAARR